jgi:glucoamylase
MVDRQHFRIVYTFDNWVTTLSKEARSVGYPGSFVDIPTTPDKTGNIIFTLAWPGQNGQERWLGKNIEVAILPSPGSAKV